MRAKQRYRQADIITNPGNCLLKSEQFNVYIPILDSSDLSDTSRFRKTRCTTLESVDNIRTLETFFRW